VAIFEWSIRVYYEDTDAGGIVYYANYLKFFERARTEYLRSKGFEQDQLRVQAQILFAVTEVHIKYQKPARFNDMLMVRSEVVKLRKAAMTFQQSIHSVEDPGATLCTAEVGIACLQEQTLRPARIPKAVCEALDSE